MNKLLLLIAVLFSLPAHSATMWCVKETKTCAHGTPSLSRLKLEDRKAALYTLTVANYNLAVANGVFIPVTSNELIRLAKEYLTPPVVVPPVEPEPPIITAPEPEPPIVVNPPHDHGNMPMVDESKNMARATGFYSLRIRPTNDMGVSTGEPSFRIQCDPSHMGVFDPVVYPNQERAGHHHNFFGNTLTNGFSTPETLKNSGNSTCRGGLGNRSAYWVPSLIDTRTNTPQIPTRGLFYYKNSTFNPSITVVKPPNGLVILAGDMSANPNKRQITGHEVIRWTCNEQYVAGHQDFIIPCSGKLTATIRFPAWWDGVNLDSPDHKSHMSYSQTATHTHRIPNITFNIDWLVDNSAHYALSSDDYIGGPKGHSLHADYLFAWDDAVLNQWFQGCIVGKRDGHGNLMCDGFELY